MSNDFLGKLHLQGRGVLFLVGVIMFSAGTVIDPLMSFSVSSLFSLMIAALPITGFWLIFAAAKKPAVPEKTLPALTLFKVAVIIDLVVVSLIALAIAIGAVFMFSQEAPQVGLVLLLAAGAVVTYIIFYYRAILGVLKALREGISISPLNALPGMKIFTIITFIRVGLTALGALIMAAVAEFISNTLGSLFGDFFDFFDFFGMDNPLSGIMGTLDNMVFSAFFTMLTSAGIIICVIVLNNFNKSLASAPLSPHTYAPPVAPQPQPSYAPPVVPPPQQPAYVPPVASPPPQPAYVPPVAPPPQAQPRMPLIFLLDTSASSAMYINYLADALNRFKAEVSRDAAAQGILDVSVVQFSDGVNILSGLAPVANMRPTRLIAGGAANYSPAVQQAAHMAGNPAQAYKPWLVLISGGNPSDDISAVSGMIQNMQQADKLRLIALSVGGYNTAALKRLTDVVFRMDGTDFSPFFEWVSQSMWAIAKTAPGGKPHLPPLQGNVYRDK